MRRKLGQRPLKQLTGGVKAFAGKLSVALIVLLICTISLFSTIKDTRSVSRVEEINVNKLWKTADSDGWRPSSAPRSSWPSSYESNGYLKVRCNGGLNQQRTAICNAVLAARIMNATLVLPDLDANYYWHDNSGFADIYDVEHFISSLKFDVQVVHNLPESTSGKKKKKLKPFQLRPPRDAPMSWYTTDALEKMKEHGAIYLTPFSHRLAEEIDDPEYQRLRCRVDFHALRFKPHIMKLSTDIVHRLRAQGHFMSIHLRFEMDMLAFAGCLDIFTPKEQKILREYREKNFAVKKLVYKERRAIGKCPLTPEEVGLILRAMGFDNSTRIYLAAGELFGGERFMRPLRAMFPRLVNHSSIATREELTAMNEDRHGLVASSVDYMVCLLSDIFMPTYDGPSNFANNLMGHRLYYGFRTTITPDRKALAPVFISREDGKSTESEFEASVRQVMSRSHFGGPHRRITPESFYTNSWPECFCQISTKNLGDKCLAENVMDGPNNQSEKENTIEDVPDDRVIDGLVKEHTKKDGFLLRSISFAVIATFVQLQLSVPVELFNKQMVATSRESRGGKQELLVIVIVGSVDGASNPTEAPGLITIIIWREFFFFENGWRGVEYSQLVYEWGFVKKRKQGPCKSLYEITAILFILKIHLGFESVGFEFDVDAGWL